MQSRNFRKPSALHPDDSGFQGNLGTAYLQKTDFAAAIAQFRAALKIDPEKASLHHDLALALKFKDDLPGSHRGVERGNSPRSEASQTPTTAWESPFGSREISRGSASNCGKPSRLNRTMPRPITHSARF